MDIDPTRISGVHHQLPHEETKSKDTISEHDKFVQDVWEGVREKFQASLANRKKLSGNKPKE